MAAAPAGDSLRTPPPASDRAAVGRAGFDWPPSDSTGRSVGFRAFGQPRLLLPRRRRRRAHKMVRRARNLAQTHTHTQRLFSFGAAAAAARHKEEGRAHCRNGAAGRGQPLREPAIRLAAAELSSGRRRLVAKFRSPWPNEHEEGGIGNRLLADRLQRSPRATLLCPRPSCARPTCSRSSAHKEPALSRLTSSSNNFHSGSRRRPLLSRLFSASFTLGAARASARGLCSPPSEPKLVRAPSRQVAPKVLSLKVGPTVPQLRCASAPS